MKNTSGEAMIAKGLPTPGPWRATGPSPVDGGHDIRSDNHEHGPGALLFRQGELFFDYTARAGELRANARLVAAAPTMYDTLMYLDAVLSFDAVLSEGKFERELVRIRAAIDAAS